MTCRMAWTMLVRDGSKVRKRSMGKESADEGKSMPMDAHLEGHERVLGQILDRILDQDDDNNEMHDGYQRRLVMVEGHTAEEAENACAVLAERVTRHYASKGRSFWELVVMRCERPPGRRRYEFGPAHARRIMEACGIQRTMLYTAMHELYRRESWTEPRLLFISDADAMAQAGRSVEEHCMKAGDFIRRLSDASAAGAVRERWPEENLRNEHRFPVPYGRVPPRSGREPKAAAGERSRYERTVLANRERKHAALKD